jgi:hypothetical protein
MMPSCFVFSLKKTIKQKKHTYRAGEPDTNGGGAHRPAHQLTIGARHPYVTQEGMRFWLKTKITQKPPGNGKGP